MAKTTYYVIGSAKVKQVLMENGFREIKSPFDHDILKRKRCYVKGETYFYINVDVMLVVRDMRYFQFQGKVVESTVFANILNSLPTKHWRALR